MTRHHATRGRQWAVEPRRSRWYGVGWGLAWLLVIIASGVRW